MGKGKQKRCPACGTAENSQDGTCTGKGEHCHPCALAVQAVADCLVLGRRPILRRVLAEARLMIAEGYGDEPGATDACAGGAQ